LWAAAAVLAIGVDCGAATGHTGKSPVSGLVNEGVRAHICNMDRERFEARAMAMDWHVVRIARDGTESTVEVWQEERARHRAEVLDRRAAEDFAARKRRYK
jgi:hypothetical protein